MIYHFIQELKEENLVNKDIAECLYTGIMTDTGGFRFRSTSATTHRIVANLIENGADPAMITSNTWDTNTVSRLHLLALILGRIELVKDGKVAILWLKRDELILCTATVKVACVDLGKMKPMALPAEVKEAFLK